MVIFSESNIFHCEMCVSGCVYVCVCLPISSIHGISGTFEKKCRLVLIYMLHKDAVKIYVWEENAFMHTHFTEYIT